MMKKKKDSEYKYSYESDGKMGQKEDVKEKVENQSEHDPTLFFNATQHSE